MRKFALIAVPYSWLLALFLIPFLIVFKISLSDIALAIPPYTPTIKDGFGALIKGLDFENFVFLTTDDLYYKAYLSSLKIALISTLLTLLVGYPMAYAMARAPDEWRATLMMLVILPFWTSFLIRVYAWIGILSNEGLLNQFLLWTGLISEPLTILNTNYAVYIGIVYTYLPFMILPIYAALERLDDSLIEAGRRPWLLASLGVLVGDDSLVENRDHCRLFSCVYPGAGRICYPVVAGWVRNVDDREGLV